MKRFTFEDHPIILILSLSRHIPNCSEETSPFILFSRKIDKYRKLINASEVKEKENNFLDSLKVIADVSLLLQSIKFRSYSAEDLKKIYDMILNGSTIIQIDNVYEFAFPFFSDSIKDITFQSIKSLLLFFQKLKKSNTQTETQRSKNSNESNFYIDLNNENIVESLSIFIFFILNSTISWIANSERIQTSEGFSLLVDKLNLIILLFNKFSNLNTNSYLSNIPNENREKFLIDFSKVKKLAINTFLFVLSYAVKHFADFTFTDEVFSSLNEFFSKLFFKNTTITKNMMKLRSKTTPSVAKHLKNINNANNDESNNEIFLNSFHVLLNLLSIELSRNSEKVPSLCNFISQVIENQSSRDFFNNELYLHIYYILSEKLSEMNETILRFFVRLSTQFEAKDETTLIQFPLFLKNFLQSNTKNPIKIVKNDEKFDDENLILVKEIENVPVINYKPSFQNYQFSFLEEKTFENGLTFIQSTEVPPPLRLYLPTEVVSRIDLVSELFSGTLFTKEFTKMLNEIDKEKNFEDFLYLLAVFLSICEDQHEIEPHFIMAIFNSPLFAGKFEDYEQENKNGNQKKFVTSMIYSSISLLVHSDALKLLMEPIINTKLSLPTVMTKIYQDLNIIFHCMFPLINKKQEQEENKTDMNDDDESIYSYFTSQPFIMIFYNVSLFYQNANLTDKQNIKEIEKTRVSLFLFMENFILKWSASHFFSVMFISYLFEPSLQPFVLSHLKSLILSGHCDEDLFISIFETCQIHLESKNGTDDKNDKDDSERNQAISLMFKILKVVNSVISTPDSSHPEKKRHHFISLHKTLTNILLKLRKDEIEFICEIIEYFSLTSDQNCIDPKTIQTFSNTIQKIGVTNEIRSKLIRLLAGNQAPSIVSHFTIEQPYALPLFVTLFIGENNSEQLNDNLKLLEQLATFSTKNAIMCHEGNLDYVILDYVENCMSIISYKERQKIIKNDSNQSIDFDSYFPSNIKVNESDENVESSSNNISDNDENNDDISMNLMNINLFRQELMMKDNDELLKEIKNAMSLFIKISLVASSIRVVRKYVSLLASSTRIKDLLSKRNEKEIEKIYARMSDFYLTNLIDLISLKFRMPTTFLPITARRTPAIEINNISASLFSEGFTATFWVYLIQQSVKKTSVLFTLSDSNEHEITAKIIDTSFIIMFYRNKKIITFTLDTTFPIEQWFLISVTVLNTNKTPNVYAITTTINSIPLSCDAQTDYFELADPLTITINGKTESSICLLNTQTVFEQKKFPVKRSSSTANYDRSTTNTYLDDSLLSKRAESIDFINGDENDDSDDGALLGPFGFFQPLPLNTIIQMQQSGPRSIPTSTVKEAKETPDAKKSATNSLKMVNINSTLAPSFAAFNNPKTSSNSNANPNTSVVKIIYVYFYKLNGVFNTVRDNDTVSTKHNIILKGPKYYQPLSFDEVLVQFFKIQSLIPLFKYEEEKADEIVSLFSMFLSLGTYIQYHFYQCHGFSTISHILKQYNGRHLTYSLYSKFINMNSQLTFQKLKTDLLKNIILRFDLWSKSSSIETRQRIIKNWIQINSDFDTNFNGNDKTFDDIIFSLDYFEVEPLKTNLLKLLFKVETNDQISLENTNKFIKYIIYQAKTLKKDVSYLLEFLLENCQYFAASNTFVNLSSILSCLALDEKESENGIKHENNLTFIIIKLLNKLYKNKKIQQPRSFYHLIDSLIDLIPIELFKEDENILKLIEYSKTIPECLPLLFYGVAFCTDANAKSSQLIPLASSASDSTSSSVFMPNGELIDDIFKKFTETKSANQLDSERSENDTIFRQKINLIVENLKPSGNYCVSKNWFLWPLIAAFRINDNFFTNFILNFIVNSVVEDQNNQPQNEQPKSPPQSPPQESQNPNQQRFSSRFRWMNVVDTIILVGEAFSTYILNKNNPNLLNKMKDINTFNFIKTFLNVLFLKEKKDDELFEFLNLCHFYIFFKPLWYQSKALQNLIKESPFRRISSSASTMSSSSHRSSYSKSTTSSTKMNKLNFCTKKDIFVQLIENFKKERKYKFSLRFDEEGNWIDRDFAIQISEESSRLPEFARINKIMKFLINKQSSLDSNPNSAAPTAGLKNMKTFIHIISEMQPFISAMNTLLLSIGKSVLKEYLVVQNDNSIESIKIHKSLFHRKMEGINNFARCCWYQLWISMNAESMPWKLNLKLKQNQKSNEEYEEEDNEEFEKEKFIDQINSPFYPTHWKLDTTPCFALCPMKLKKDFHYFSHKSLREIQLFELNRIYKKQLKLMNNDKSIKKKELMKKVIAKVNQNEQKAKQKKKKEILQPQQSQSQQSQIQYAFIAPTIENVNTETSVKNEENNELVKKLPILKIRCELITIKQKLKGRCFFYQDKIELRFRKPKSKTTIAEEAAASKEETTDNKDHVNHPLHEEEEVKKSIEIYYDEIRLILSRMILQRPSGIEIFTHYHRSFLLNFPRLHYSQVLLKFNSICQNKNICILSFPSQSSGSSFSAVSFSFSMASTVPPPQTAGSGSLTTSSEIKNNPSSIYSSFLSYLFTITHWWKNGYMSNFVYLIELNLLSGRSFNDPSMYPVFPWIVNDYDCKKIRWKDKDFYRDLSLPVGALNKERLNELCVRRKEMLQFDSDFIFLYGAGYSTPLSLFNWMIRLEPFASLHVEMQNGHFDHPHRLFHSIKNAYKMSTSNANDYRELIPEFFFLPGFLENKNKFNFGSLDEQKMSLEIANKTSSRSNSVDSLNETNQSSTANEDENENDNENEEEAKKSDDDSISINEEEDDVFTAISSSSQSHNDKEQFVIDDVSLPAWATSPIDFVYKHRKILESKYVSRHLNEWIDLIFGVEQGNNEINQFHPWMYPNVWEKRKQLIKQRRSSNVSEQLSNLFIGSSNYIQPTSITMFSSSSSVSQSASNVIDEQKEKESENGAESRSNESSEVGTENETDSGAADELGIPSTREIEGFLTQCGQIPQQLFNEKHPVKQKMKKQNFLKENLVVNIIGMKAAGSGSSSGNGSNGDSSIFFFSSASQSSAASQVPKEKIQLQVEFAQFARKEKHSNAGEMREKLIFVLVASDGVIYKASVSTIGVECEQINERVDNNIPNIDFSQKKFHFFRGYLVVSTINGNLKVFNLKNGSLCKELKAHIGKLNCITSDHLLLVSSGSDTTTNIYDHKFDLIYSIPSFRGEIISSYINFTFSIVASITKDSTLFMISTSTGTITRVISLRNRVPLLVIVTNAWGFIVVFAQENIFNKQKEKWQICNFLIMYSINGEKICERKVDFLHSISAWTTFTSCDGFDYLAICDDKGDLYVFEVYPFISSTTFQSDNGGKEKVDANDDFIDLNEFVEESNSSTSLEPIFKSNRKIKTLFYWNDYRIIVGIGSDGSAFFVPLDYQKI